MATEQQQVTEPFAERHYTVNELAAMWRLSGEFVRQLIQHEAGVSEWVFEPFYSGKGDEGRGLGLYIARQLLERHEYSIQLADLKAHKPLKGASFVISFVRDSR